MRLRTNERNDDDEDNLSEGHEEEDDDEQDERGQQQQQEREFGGFLMALKSSTADVVLSSATREAGWHQPCHCCAANERARFRWTATTRVCS
jgi:hypothetical protein